MRRFTAVLPAAVAVVSLTSFAFAQADKAKAEKPAAKVEQATAKKAAPAAPSAAGKIAKFDEASKVLVVTTPKDGDKTFTLGASTKIVSGAKALKTTDLVVGREVKVTYREADGKMTATRIAVAAEKKGEKT